MSNVPFGSMEQRSWDKSDGATKDSEPGPGTYLDHDSKTAFKGAKKEEHKGWSVDKKPVGFGTTLKDTVATCGELEKSAEKPLPGPGAYWLEPHQASTFKRKESGQPAAEGRAKQSSVFRSQVTRDKTVYS